MNLETKTYRPEANKGLVALVAILIIFVVVLLAGLSSSLLNIGETKLGVKKNDSSQAYFLASLCAEEALIKLKEDINYSGGEVINIEEGACQILPIEGNWIIKTSSNFQDQTKKIKVVVSQVNPQMVIDSWQTVADF
jgi:hypothetical protein